MGHNEMGAAQFVWTI